MITSLTFPESMTKTTSLMVMLVSAMLVERICKDKDGDLLPALTVISGFRVCKLHLKQELTIFLTPVGGALKAFFWSRVCISECRMNSWNLHDKGFQFFFLTHTDTHRLVDNNLSV